MSHRCEENDPRRDTQSFIHPEELPDEPFFLIPEVCHCNYEMRYEVVKIEDYMKDRSTYYQRAVERQARMMRRILQDIENNANNGEAAEQQQNEGDNAAAAEQPRNEDDLAEAAEQQRIARMDIAVPEAVRIARNARAAAQAQNERNNAGAAEQPQNPRIDMVLAAQIRNDRRMRVGVERLLHDREIEAAERRQAAVNPRAAELPAERPRNDENLENPQENPRRPGVFAAILQEGLDNLDRIYDEQRLAPARQFGPAFRNMRQAAQRPVPGLEPLSRATISQDEFDAER